MRVGIVGCGKMGVKHLSVLSEIPDFLVSAVCDLSPRRLAELPERLAPRDARFERYGDMYEQVPLDLVVVATSPADRVSPVTEALDRGIAVLCEKPLATDLLSADRMVEAAAKSGKILAVHHQYGVSAALRRCRSLIASGLIGEVLMIRGRGKAGRRAGVELLEIGTHLADTMIALAGRPDWCSASIYEGHRLALPNDVRNTREVAQEEAEFGPVVGTRVAARYGFAGGVIGEMHFLGYEDRMPENYGVDILGAAGQLALRCSRFVTRPLWHLPRPMEGTPDQLDDWRAVHVPGSGNKGLVQAFYLDLLQALRGDGAVPCEGQQGRIALEMVLAAFTSHRDAGRRIPLPLTERAHPLESWGAARA